MTRAHDLDRGEFGARAERAALLRMFRSEIRAVRTAKKRQLLTDDVASDRVRRLQVMADKVRLGLHRIEGRADG